MKPLWEDENCKNGGRFTIRTPKTHTAKYWEDLLLAMIGEQFEDIPSGEVLGLVMKKSLLAYKNDEWERYHQAVTDWEVKEYLRLY